jgi:7,8-dihydropterin-6-yl-methyl-4-(beta-D-ribofuranosyl)aminobenzene 5'-phosphate synthase
MKFIALLDLSKNAIDSFVAEYKKRTTDKVKIRLRPHITGDPIEGRSIFTILESEKLGDVLDYCKMLEKQGVKVRLIPIYDERTVNRALKKFYKAKKRAERHNKKSKNIKQKIGFTDNLEVLPLIDWKTDDEELFVETGVSYLIKTDENTILFDTGLNRSQENPSPLLKNMKMLGIDAKEIDIVFLTHNHGDHVGGGKWAKEKTFSLSGRQIELNVEKIYTPVKMTYPGQNPTYSPEPTIIGKGVSSTGTIANSIAETLFNEPIYGIIGGLHYPVRGGPFELYGYAMHKYAGTGKPPWEHISIQELQANIELLRQRNLKVIALSPHDSSSLSIQTFKETFPEAYIELKVGKSIKM